LNTTEDWLAKQKPRFETINIHPTLVIGRDDLVTSPEEIIKGTNAIVIGPLLGHGSSDPNPGSSVHLDDVAELHVRSLDPSIPGNANYLGTANPPDGIDWAESFAFVKREYPREVEKGVFKVDTTEVPKSVPVKIGGELSEKTFGLKFKSFEEQVRSLAEHYLELRGVR